MSLNSKANSAKFSSSLTRISEVPKLCTNTLKNLSSQLNLARNKLVPVINEILKTASENTSRLPYQAVKSYHLTVEQYKDAVWASNVLKEVADILKYNKIKIDKHFANQQNFNFNTKDIKVNKNGKIYVDTPILVQLIDLHNTLGDIIKFIKDIPLESFTNRDKSETSSKISKKGKQQGDKVNKEMLGVPLNTNFLVMAANSVQKSKMPPLIEERSTSEINLPSQTVMHVRQVKSTGSVMSTKQKSKVVDAVAARKIIIRCLADLEKVKQYLEEDSSPSSASLNQCECPEPAETCICIDKPTDRGEPLNFVWMDDGEHGSKLTICIKGKTEEEGDIHVVIRQCPECQGVDQNSQFNISIDNLQKSCSKVSLSGKRESEERSFSRPSSQQGQRNGINVYFDPDEPAQSIVEGPQIKLFETVNLNLKNDEGQDLVISLCVRPKCPPSCLDLDKIFSECRCLKSKVNVAETMIPLSRTKICSSMEFDVDLVVSKLQMAGIKHPNKEVADQLNNFGVSNLLRASRPVKCGRKAVLNEYQKKSLPYTPSLRSLPLDDDDIAVINQSIFMNIHKSKHSKIFPETNQSSFVYFLNIHRQNVGFFDAKRVKDAYIAKKLSYYIYLDDGGDKYDNSVEVRYFDVKIEPTTSKCIRKSITRVPVTLKRFSSNKIHRKCKYNPDKLLLEYKVTKSNCSLSKTKINYLKRSSSSPYYNKSVNKREVKRTTVETKSNILSETITKQNIFEKYINLVNDEKNVSPKLITIKDVTNKSNSSSNETINLLMNKPMKKKKKRKIDFFATKSQIRLNNKVLERKLTLLDFAKFTSRKISREKLDDLALSSLRFKRNQNKKSFSRTIIDNLSGFLYETLIRGLTDDAKIEILSKIDEFLCNYSRLRNAWSKCKCRKYTDVPHKMDATFLVIGSFVLNSDIMYKFSNVINLKLNLLINTQSISYL